MPIAHRRVCSAAHCLHTRIFDLSTTQYNCCSAQAEKYIKHYSEASKRETSTGHFPQNQVLQQASCHSYQSAEKRKDKGEYAEPHSVLPCSKVLPVHPH